MRGQKKTRKHDPRGYDETYFRKGERKKKKETIASLIHDFHKYVHQKTDIKLTKQSSGN